MELVKWVVNKDGMLRSWRILPGLRFPIPAAVSVSVSASAAIQPGPSTTMSSVVAYTQCIRQCHALALALAAQRTPCNAIVAHNEQSFPGSH